MQSREYRTEKSLQSIVQLPSSGISSWGDTALSPVRLFEKGEIFFRQGDLQKSIFFLKKAKNRFIKEKNFRNYFDCCDMLFHSLYERCETSALEDMKLEFESVCEKYNIEQDPRTLAMMIFYFIETSKKREALGVLKKTLNLVLKREAENRQKNNRLKALSARLDVIYCIYAYVSYYCRSGQAVKFQKEVSNLNVLIENYSQMESQIIEEKSRTDNSQDQKQLDRLLKSLRKSSSFVRRINAHAKHMSAVMEGDYSRRGLLLKSALDEALRFKNDHLMKGYIYLNMSQHYLEIADPAQSAVYLKLAEQCVENDNFKRFSMRALHIKEHLELLNAHNQTKNYDIIFDKAGRFIVEKQKGQVSFKSQLILWNVLNLLASRPGRSFSKQDLVEMIWKQDYMPLVHDNKIYVTLKRLRELVEPSGGSPVYIQRTGEGYHFNKYVNMLIRNGGLPVAGDVCFISDTKDF